MLVTKDTNESNSKTLRGMTEHEKDIVALCIELARLRSAQNGSGLEMYKDSAEAIVEEIMDLADDMIFAGVDNELASLREEFGL